MKNKNGKGNALVIFLIAIIAIAVVAGVVFMVVNNSSQSVTNAQSGSPNSNNQQGTNGQNPSIDLAFTNQLTGATIPASITNYKDVTQNRLLGKVPSLATGQVVIPIVNSSGYLTAVQPSYTVISGNQNLQGSLYAFANVTIQIYNNAQTGLIGGNTNGVSVGNDSKFTTIANNKIVLTGNPYKSSGRLFLVMEIGTTTNVSQVTLSNGGTAISSIAVPNCYSNFLTGTPFRVAWELPAVVGGTQAIYNLQTQALNGNTVQNATQLTFYAEQDGVDSLNANLLTSGICDSANTAFWYDKQQVQWTYN